MTRKIKALGLALFATFALGAIGAQGAMAEALFHSTSEVTHLTGEQEDGEGQINRFILDDKEPNPNYVECEKSTFEATIEEKTVTDVTLEAKYDGCGVNGAANANAVVDMNGCHYTLTSHLEPTTTIEEEVVSEHATVEIVCPSEQHIEITIEGGLCRVDVYPQTEEELTHGIVYDNIENEGKHTDITGTVTVHGIHWSTTNHFFCTVGGIGAATGNDATYISSVTIEGFEDEAHTKKVGIWWGT